MKKIILSVALAALTNLSFGQVVVRGVSPVAVEGNYSHTWADNWGQTFDLSIPGNTVTAEIVLVEDGTPGTNPQGNPISQEGCNALTNAPDVAGKIAVVYRNTCEFGTKALNAQNAGAVGVIIVNRDNEVIAMGGGADGGSVTIPVVMLSSADGAILIDAINNPDPVVVFMGNKAGLYDDDLGGTIGTTLLPKSYGISSQLAQNASEFSFEMGMRVYNYGNNAQNNITVHATIEGPSSTLVYDEVSDEFSLAGLNGVIIDSSDVAPGEMVSLPTFSLASYPEGRYIVTYTVSNAATTDEFGDDNVITTEFEINDKIISYGMLDVANMPVSSNYYQSGDFSTSYSSCISFRDANASRIGVNGLYFSATSAAETTLEGDQVQVYFYEWNDPFADLNGTVTYDALNELRYVDYSFPGDDQEVVQFVQFDQLVLEDNVRYLACVQTYNQDVFLGHDTKTNYSWNVDYYLQPISLTESDGTYYAVGFGSDIISSVAVDIFNADELAINAASTVEGKAYPNPATDNVTLSVDMEGSAVLNITDITGKQVANNAISFANGTSNVDISNLVAGVYIFNVTYENGQTSIFNIVKK